MLKKAIFVISLLIVSQLSVADYPKAANEYVNDYANVLDLDTIAELRQQLKDVEYYSGVEITVLTIESYREFATNDPTWEAFATGLFNYWGVGNLALNDGVLFMISTGDRKIRL